MKVQKGEGQMSKYDFPKILPSENTFRKTLTKIFARIVAFPKRAFRTFSKKLWPNSPKTPYLALATILGYFVLSFEVATLLISMPMWLKVTTMLFAIVVALMDALGGSSKVLVLIWFVQAVIFAIAYFLAPEGILVLIGAYR